MTSGRRVRMVKTARPTISVIGRRNHKNVDLPGGHSARSGSRFPWAMLLCPTMRHAPRPHLGAHLRRGLTLVEVLLVLSLLVVIGAIAVPLLENSFSRASLYGAGD